jgi:uncharacterized OsmC-like protein
MAGFILGALTVRDISAALKRAGSVLRRRPSAGIHDDAPGLARWVEGLRIETSHASGHKVFTDMAAELGGRGGEVSPGWMVRAGIAACTATMIASLAALEEVELQALEVRVTSRSDLRGYLGMADADGAPVYQGPHELQMHVRIAARGVSPERLHALVEAAQQRAPMTALAQDARHMDVRVEIGDA